MTAGSRHCTYSFAGRGSLRSFGFWVRRSCLRLGRWCARSTSPPDSAERSLQKFSDQAGIHLIFSPELADGVRTQAVQGRFTVAAAAERLLAGTSLKLVPDAKTGIYSIARSDLSRAKPEPSLPARSSSASGSLKKNEANPLPDKKRMKTSGLFTKLATTLALLLSHPGAMPGQATSSGSIEGRVMNAGSGDALNNARITVPGTSLETRTNELGEYKLANLPSGPVTVSVTYLGFTRQSASVAVSPGAVVTRDFALNLEGSDARTPEIVKLDAFRVEERQLSGQAVALQEQADSAGRSRCSLTTCSWPTTMPVGSTIPSSDSTASTGRIARPTSAAFSRRPLFPISFR